MVPLRTGRPALPFPLLLRRGQGSLLYSVIFLSVYEGEGVDLGADAVELVAHQAEDAPAVADQDVAGARQLEAVQHAPRHTGLGQVLLRHLPTLKIVISC